MRRRGLVTLVLVVLLLLGGAADAYLTDLARSNLSNADFQRTHERTPADVGVPSVDVRIPSDGRQLVGWWMPAVNGSANASTTVILVHGLGSTMGKMVRMWAPNLHSHGYSLLALDLRNHGASPDAPGGLVTYGVTESDDVAAAVTFVQDHAAEFGVDPDRIVLYGGSMGAATVLETGARHLPGVAGVIADGSYASFAFQAQIDGAHQGYPKWLIDLVVHRMDQVAPAPPTHSRPEAAIPSIDVPILLLACRNDQRITSPNFDRLNAAIAPGQDAWTWTDDCPTGLSKDHHLDGFMKADYNSTVLSFLDQGISGRPV